MSDSDTLSTKQRRFLTALANTPTVRDAAREAGISEPSGWRYLREPAVKGELARRQDALLTQVTTGLAAPLTLTFSNVTTTSLTVTWPDATDETSYELYRWTAGAQPAKMPGRRRGARGGGRSSWNGRSWCARASLSSRP